MRRSTLLFRVRPLGFVGGTSVSINVGANRRAISMQVCSHNSDHGGGTLGQKQGSGSEWLGEVDDARDKLLRSLHQFPVRNFQELEIPRTPQGTKRGRAMVFEHLCYSLWVGVRSFSAASADHFCL